MTTCFLAPDPIQSTQFIPGGNTPANGGQLFFYQAGSSTKQTVYKDNAGSVAWTNPIVLDSGGNLPSGGEVWFQTGITIKAVFAPSTDTDPPSSPYWTKDNLAGINDTSSTQSEWASGPTPTFVTGIQFTVAGDQTTTFVKARRLKFTVTAGTVYGVVTSASFAVNTTTVNVAFDSGALDAGLSAVSYSLLAATNNSISADYVNKQVTSVTAASTTNIWGISGNSLHVAGNVTTAIQSFSSAPYVGAIRELVFDGISQLTHNATTLVMPGLANVTTAAGDVARVYADNGSTKVLSFTRASGVPVVGPQASNTVFAGPISGASTAPAFRTLGGLDGAGLVFIASTNANNTTSIDSGALPSYPIYQVYLQNVLPSTTVSIGLRYSSSNGASYDSTNAYSYAGATFTVAGAITGVGTNSDSRLQLVSAVASTSVNGVTGLLTVQPFTGLTVATWSVIAADPAGNTISNQSGGRYGATANAIRVLPTAGTINGTVYFYGVRAP